MKLTDDQVRELAESCDFWGHDYWWKHNIPRFREFAKQYEELMAGKAARKFNRQIRLTEPPFTDATGDRELQ